ncbi:MAG: nucleotidyltransferase [Deltaproteobacteria bacterium]|nr:nucleotidyltransferase [Deltaproteobacteria bacterium]
MKTHSFDAFCRACLDALKAQRTRYVVIGGLAVTVVGEPRLTADLDVIVFADHAALRALITYATKHGFTADIETEVEAARQGESIRLDRGNFHFDLIVRSLFIEDLAYEHSRLRKLFGRMVRFPSPEDLAVLKVVAGRPRDLLDVEGIIRRHGPDLNRRYVEATLEKVCELAEDHEILARWRRLIGARRR